MNVNLRKDISKDLSDIIKSTLVNNNFKYEIGSTGVFYCGFSVKDFKIKMELIPGPRFIVINAFYRFFVNPEDFGGITTRLNSINNYLPVGSFQMNEEGEVYCKNSFYLFERLPTQNEVHHHIMTTLALVDINREEIFKELKLES